MARTEHKGFKGKKFDKPKDLKATTRRLWEYLKQSKKKLILIFIVLIISVIIDMLSIYILAPIIDEHIVPMISNPTNEEYARGFIYIMITFAILKITYVIVTYASSKLMIKIAQDTIMNMRNDLICKIEKLPIKYFDTHPHGELMSKITNDMDNLGNTLNTSITQIISGFFTILFMFIAMFIISPMLSLISLCIVPTISLIVIKISKLNRKQFIKQQESLAKVNSYIEEYVSGQRAVKAFNQEEKILNDFKEKNNTLRDQGFKAQYSAGVVMPVAGAINMIGTAVIMIVAGILAIKGKMTVGSIVSFNMLSSHFGRPINEISYQFSVMQLGVAGAERMFEVMDSDEEFPDNVGKEVLKSVKGHVEFKNVSFGYSPNEYILKNFNLEIKPGEVVALVGPTGAGKTTVINLLTRFYDVDEGEILVDGKNIKEIDKHSLREVLGIVLQDTVMFSESIKDNIKYGKLDATDEEIKASAKVSNADMFIEHLAEGYDTIVAEDGNNISFGQKQLINISRVALNNPQILILDEATSNVDTRTEVHVQEAMKKLLRGRTSLVIAHRLSTIREADKIVVIDHGKIVEQGKHEELVQNKGMYFNMYTGMFG